MLYTICERLLELCDRTHTRSPGLLKTTSIDETETLVDFQLTNSESFCKYFYSAAKSIAAEVPNSRPQSNMTIQLSSGFASPDTGITELSCGSGSSITSRRSTADSKNSATATTPSLPPVEGLDTPVVQPPPQAPTSSDNANKLPALPGAKRASPQAPSTSYHVTTGFVSSLPTVEELSDPPTSESTSTWPEANTDLNGMLDPIPGPLRQIDMVGLDTPKRTRRDDNGRRSEPNSPSDSLTSLIEKTLGVRVMQVASPVVYNKVELEQPQESTASDDDQEFSNFEEALARSGLVAPEMYQDFDEHSLEGREKYFSDNFEDQFTGRALVDPYVVASGLLSDHRTNAPQFLKQLTEYQVGLIASRAFQ